MMEDLAFYFDDYKMRTIRQEDLELYYKWAVVASDEEAKYFTGTINSFSKDQIASYLKTIVDCDSRYDFLILKEDQIIGELVLSDIEKENCHYRICIFSKENFSKGIGYQATHVAFDFAFKRLNLETIELEVFPFNERGIGLYKKMGFLDVEAIVDDEAEDPYKNINLMRLKKESYYKNL
jgi:RimJ/RimL family protein N-acetyltransferase